MIDGLTMSATLADKCRVPPLLWRTVMRAGLRPEMLLQHAGLPATLHLNTQAIVTTAQFFALWKAIERLMPEPGLGIRMVEALDTIAHPPSVLIAFHARDYREGLVRLARFKRLCTPEQLLCDEVKGECKVTVMWPHATEPTPAIAIDVTFATLIELGRRGSGQRITPNRIELARSNPRSDVHHRYFGCPIRFGAAADVLVLKSTDLRAPFPGHNPEMLDLLTPALSSALEEIQVHDSTGAQVKILMKRALASGRPELSQIARDLGVSERTLQRRITEEGTTFRALLSDARRELGRQLLSARDMSINEVAYLLGYQDTNAFHRAFREWEGVSPARWRDLQSDKQTPSQGFAD
jgi:AraC-like DNA-binding protein